MLSHKDLVKQGLIWLIQSKGCNPVFSEVGSAKMDEVPDVVGWKGEECIVVECKASVSDFWADFKKPHRTNGQGLGVYRFYLMEQEIFDSVYAKAKGMCEGRLEWGFVVANKHARARQVRRLYSKKFESNIENERNFLRSRILQIQRFGREY